MTLSKTRVSPWFLLALLILLGAVAFRLVAVFLSYLLFGLFLAYLTYPVYAWLLKRVKRPGATAGLMLLAIVLVLLVPMAFLMAALVQQVQDLIAVAGGADPQAVLDALALRINTLLGLSGQPHSTSSSLVNDIYDNLQDAATAWIRNVPQQLLEAILGVFLLAYVLYYSYTDGQRWIDGLRELLPMQSDHREALFHDVGHVIRGVMYGTILMSALQAALAALGFAIFGVPNIALWSVLVFILALLPIVGAPFVWVPWGLYLIYIGEPFRGVGLLIYSAVLVNGIEHLLRPKLIGTVANIHPLIVLLGVVGGLAVFGFIGFILGPLVLSVFVTVLNLYRKEFAARRETEPIMGPT